MSKWISRGSTGKLLFHKTMPWSRRYGCPKVFTEWKGCISRMILEPRLRTTRHEVGKCEISGKTVVRYRRSDGDSVSVFE